MRNMFNANLFFGLSILAAGTLLMPSAGLAAPQALGLIATNGDVELNCDGHQCSAEFSSFCLQKNRTSPARGTAYHLIGKGALALTGTKANGNSISMDAGSTVQFRALRTHVAVRISVPQSIMQKHGLTRITLNVGHNVTLAPDPVDGDLNPQDEASLAMAAGTLRSIGTRFVDTNSARMAAARITNQWVNGGPVPTVDAARMAMQTAAGPSENARAQEKALNALNMCHFAKQRRVLGDVRECLQGHHDQFLDFLNSNYWKATGAGS